MSLIHSRPLWAWLSMSDGASPADKRRVGGSSHCRGLSKYGISRSGDKSPIGDTPQCLDILWHTGALVHYYYYTYRSTKRLTVTGKLHFPCSSRWIHHCTFFRRQFARNPLVWKFSDVFGCWYFDFFKSRCLEKFRLFELNFWRLKEYFEGMTITGWIEILRWE